MELTKWLNHELPAAQKEESKWRENAKQVVKRYRDERDRNSESSHRYSLNILYANTETLRPSFYSATPSPLVRRRYKDDDPLGKAVSEILERSLEFFSDEDNFDDFGRKATDDILLPGRTVCKVEYKPLFEKTQQRVGVDSSPVLNALGEEIGSEFSSPDGAPVSYDDVQSDDEGFYIMKDGEEFLSESVCLKRWPWEDFARGPGRNWEDVPWIAYRSYLSESELKKNFKGKKIELTHYAEGQEKKKGDTAPTHAEIWEVWFKAERKVRIGSHGYKDRWIDEYDDPLQLEQFFPTPAPLYAISNNDNLVPIPDFTIYQDQADELDRITHRLNMLIDAMKVRGIYAGDSGFLDQLFSGEENSMIPVPDWHNVVERGGVSGMVDYLPIEQIAKVAQGLFREREQLIQTIFQITGISDVMRGMTDPRETARAQTLKSQFGSRRLVVRQRLFQRYLRDCLRLVAEVMSNHFSLETFQQMTGLPVTEEHLALMRNDLLRTFRIDIETDSTVAPDEQAEKQQMAEALQTIGQFMGTMAPIIQTMPGLLPPSISVLQRFLRSNKFGREIEDVFEVLKSQPPPPNPEDAKAQGEAQAKQAEVQQKAQESQMKLQIEAQASQQEQARKDAETQAKLEIMRQEFARDQARKDRETSAKVQTLLAKARSEMENKEEITEAQVSATKLRSRSSDTETDS